MPTPPTLISYTETASWVTTGSPKTVTISFLAGDVISVVAGTEGPTTVPGVPTATGLTFNSMATNNAASTCSSRASQAVAAGDGTNVVISATGPTSNHWGFGCWVHRGSAGTGTAAEQHTTTKTVNQTPTGANASMVWGVFDFSAETAHTGTPAPTNTGEATVDAGRYTAHAFDLADQTSAGATAYGVTGGLSTGPYSIVVLEIKAAAAALPSLDQEGFRWRNDDGSEATATWKAAQDTTVALTPGDSVRLRMVVNAVSDTPAKRYTLQYRKVGDASWRTIDQFE